MHLVSEFNNKEIMEALTWMVLGDGHIEKKERGNSCLAISHTVDHTDYLLWKGSIVERVTGFSLYEQTMGHSDLSHYGRKKMIRLRSRAHPWFTKIGEHLYASGKKAISKHSIALLGPIGLAILYQDDGSLSITTSRGTPEKNLLIHTLSHSYYELEALTKHIVDNYGLIFRINHDGNKGLRIRLRQKDVDAFIAIIEPYIVPSMLYKLGRGGDSDTTIGDIVWSSWQQEEESRDDSPAALGWKTRRSNINGNR